MTIRVVVADDQEIVRVGLVMILNAQPGIVVVGEAANGREAVDLARRLRPDVCLFDIRMPVIDEIAAELRITLSTVKSHIASLMTKLSARNRVEIAIWAYETRRIRKN